MLFGLAGKAGCGKSTVAQLIQDATESAEIVKMAQPLYQAAIDFGWDGVKDAKGRRLLQELGDTLRQYDSDGMLKLWRVTLEKSRKQHTVCDDIRFNVEAAMIRNNLGAIIHIQGRNDDLGTNATHSTEQGINVISTDIHLDNSGDYNTLCANVMRILESLNVETI